MRRSAVAAIVVAAVIVLAGGGLLSWWLTRPAGPDATASAYFDALAEGAGDRAVQLLADPGDTDTMIAALEGATSRVEHVRVTETAVDGDDATVTVGFELTGIPQSARVTLMRQGGQWRIAPSATGTVTADAPIGAAVSVGGVLTGLGQEVRVLPAEYDVTAAPAGVLVGTATVTVLPGSAVMAEVPAALSANAISMAQSQLEAYEDRCTRTATAAPDRCGLRVPWAADLAMLDRIDWRIEQRPTLVLSDDGRTFAATAGAVVATATGTTPSGMVASFTYRADDWALRGGITFSPDAMTLEVS